MTHSSSHQTAHGADRSSLRKKLIDTRLAATIAQREDWDRSIIEDLRPHLLKLSLKLALRKIGAYWPIRNEPDLRSLLAELDQAGFEIGLPQVIGPEAPLQFLRWRTDSAMTNGAFNVAVPESGEPIIPELLLIPCVGFFSTGEQLFRLGYGGGYYDRTLAAHPVTTMGVAYECARILDADGFLTEPHDVALDHIVTETGWV